MHHLTREYIFATLEDGVEEMSLNVLVRTGSFVAVVTPASASDPVQEQLECVLPASWTWCCKDWFPWCPTAQLRPPLDTTCCSHCISTISGRLLDMRRAGLPAQRQCSNLRGVRRNLTWGCRTKAFALIRLPSQMMFISWPISRKWQLPCCWTRFGGLTIAVHIG